MKLEKIIEQLKPNTTISRKEYDEIVRKKVPNISERTIYWQLAKLQEMGVIQKIGQNAFYVKGSQSGKREYFYGYSKEMKKMVDMIKTEYPLVDFQVWEFLTD